VVQFIKGRSDTGEESFYRQQPGVSWHVMGEGFTWETQDRARDVAAAEAAWAQACSFLRDPGIGLVVLDELNIALKYGYLEVDRVVADLMARPVDQHVVVTGRAAPPELVAVADTVTDMTVVKHAFAAGIKAMAGMEW
jgi:cob(I)alamin adenosyltransferase